MNAPARPLIAGNWKMNGSLNEALALAESVTTGVDAETAGRCELLICPPAVHIHDVVGAVRGGIAVGAQDCHPEPAGAFTGDISAEMLVEIGCSYVIVGHSERRAGHGETDAVVQAKARAAHRAGLVAIICIGETEAEREAGETLAVLSRQLRGSLPSGAGAANTVIAYEPVWAIGTGRTPEVDDIAAAHAHIRQEVEGLAEQGGAVRLLYGGSMKPDNAPGILAIAHVNGGLIGGASLDAGDFLAIAASCP
jgi:triosephosphate isomerase